MCIGEVDGAEDASTDDGGGVCAKFVAPCPSSCSTSLISPIICCFDMSSTCSPTGVLMHSISVVLWNWVFLGCFLDGHDLGGVSGL